MAALSGTADRRGCKYGLWISLVVLVVQFIGGEYRCRARSVSTDDVAVSFRVQSTRPASTA